MNFGLVNDAKKKVKMTMIIAIWNGSTNVEHSVSSKTSLISSLLLIVFELLLIFAV